MIVLVILDRLLNCGWTESQAGFHFEDKTVIDCSFARVLKEIFGFWLTKAEPGMLAQACNVDAFGGVCHKDFAQNVASV